MAIQALRGFRDFYPEDQAKIKYLYDQIAATCARFGYEEFEGPAVESFSLYAAKSSDEIVNEQAFLLKSRGDEDSQMVLRPELTPTLARMVAAKQNQLAFPLRWWSFGRFWRYERPQKGRAREFYQWNCDLLGEDSVEADVEIIEITIRLLQSMKLTSQDVVVELNDRAFANQLLAKNNIPTEKSPAAFKLIDRQAKLSPEERVSYGRTLGLSESDVATILDLFAPESDAWQQSPRLQAVIQDFEARGLKDWVAPNLSIVRGFTYYTGLVFEVTDRVREYRALLGGGRYSNLVAEVGGQPVDGIGLGMGDMVLLSFLESKNLVPEYKTQTQVSVITVDEASQTWAQQVLSQLREQGINTVFYGITTSIGKGLKFTSQKQIPFAIIIGPNEAAEKKVTLKNLESGDQQTISIEEAIILLSSWSFSTES